MRLTKCQEHALMFLYFWGYFNQDREYWWSEDCMMKEVTVKSMIRHDLFDSSHDGAIILLDKGYNIARDKWRKNDKWRPLFLKMNAVYGDGAP